MGDWCHMHIVSFHCNSGEVKVVEDTVSLGIFVYTGNCQTTTGGGLHHQMEPHIRC